MVSLIVPMPTLAAGADLEQRPILINSDHPENCLALRRHTMYFGSSPSTINTSHPIGTGDSKPPYKDKIFITPAKPE